MKIACLFDGAGLARLGLEQAGHDVTGFELDPWKHYLSGFVGSGKCLLADVTKVDLRSFDAVWASPPCQLRSSARTQGPPVSAFAKDYLKWCLGLKKDILWVENIVSQSKSENGWGRKWNAVQFLKDPIQNRNRMVGGRYLDPHVFRSYRRFYKEFEGIVCPTVTATEFKGCASDHRRASRFYGRKLTIQECAYRQGLEIPSEWLEIPDGFSRTRWDRNLYEAIGNGVPVYMAKAFGEAYPK